MIRFVKDKHLSTKYFDVHFIEVDGVKLPKQTLSIIEINYGEIKVQCFNDKRLTETVEYDWESVPYQVRKRKIIKGDDNNIGVINLFLDESKVKRCFEFWK